MPDRPQGRHARAAGRHPARRDEHVDDDQRDGGLAAGALHRHRRGATASTPAALQGTTQNDIIKEFLARGTYAFPPGPSMRLIADMVAYTVERRPEVEPDQHLLLPPAGGRARRRCRRSPTRWPTRSPCSTRCASASTQDAHGQGLRAHLVLRQRRRALRRGARQAARDGRCCGRSSAASATASRTPSTCASATACRSTRSGLTEAQPENNVQRIVLEALAVTLGPQRPRPRDPAAGLERGARPAAPVGPAVVAAHPAGARLRDRPARVPRHLRGLEGHGRPRRRAARGRARRDGGRRRARRRGRGRRLHEGRAGRLPPRAHPPHRGRRAGRRRA